MAKMHAWTTQFQDQLRVFAADRHKSYDKAFDQLKKLEGAGFEDYAMDFANGAQLLSDDKKAFHDQPLMKQLIDDAIKNAATYEKNEDWLRASRLYSDLAAIEPASKDWKDKLKDCMRRVRLLAAQCCNSSTRCWWAAYPLHPK